MKPIVVAAIALNAAVILGLAACGSTVVVAAASGSGSGANTATSTTSATRSASSSSTASSATSSSGASSSTTSSSTSSSSSSSGDAGLDGDACVPTSCEPKGLACGPTDDGCGNMINCGSCPGGEVCGGAGQPGQCGTCECSPENCAQLGFDCGMAAYTCGGPGCGALLLECGTCRAPETCGGGGQPNVCGISDAGADACVPTTCAAQNYWCGTLDDGCGGTLDCGSCMFGGTCGGCGVAGQCGQGCCPLSCAQQAFNCGVHGDGCGNAIVCGTCTAPRTCGGSGDPGVCGTPPDGGVDACAPMSCAQQGFNCGFATDGCDNIISCGTCAAGQTCGGGGTANVCGP
jgi:hypothetical protein